MLAQPKRLAFLAYLALTRTPHRRESLLALFWPEQDDERARLALRQSVHFLRTTLGAAVVVSRSGEEVALGEGVVRCDAAEFERALDAGARIEYDPSLVVEHPLVPDDVSVGLRDGATVGYLLRKHGYPRRERARMLVRPLGGAIVSLGRADLERARYHAATLRGRIRGLRAT